MDTGTNVDQGMSVGGGQLCGCCHSRPAESARQKYSGLADIGVPICSDCKVTRPTVLYRGNVPGLIGRLVQLCLRGRHFVVTEDFEGQSRTCRKCQRAAVERRSPPVSRLIVVIAHTDRFEPGTIVGFRLPPKPSESTYVGFWTDNTDTAWFAVPVDGYIQMTGAVAQSITLPLPNLSFPQWGPSDLTPRHGWFRLNSSTQAKVAWVEPANPTALPAYEAYPLVRFLRPADVSGRKRTVKVALGELEDRCLRGFEEAMDGTPSAGSSTTVSTEAIPSFDELISDPTDGIILYSIWNILCALSDLMKISVTYFADLAMSPEGYNLLMLATELGSDLVFDLLEAGCDPHICGPMGSSLEIANQKRNQRFIDAMQSTPAPEKYRFALSVPQVEDNDLLQDILYMIGTDEWTQQDYDAHEDILAALDEADDSSDASDVDMGTGKLEESAPPAPAKQEAKLPVQQPVATQPLSRLPAWPAAPTQPVSPLPQWPSAGSAAPASAPQQPLSRIPAWPTGPATAAAAPAPGMPLSRIPAWPSAPTTAAGPPASGMPLSRVPAWPGAPTGVQQPLSRIPAWPAQPPQGAAAGGAPASFRPPQSSQPLSRIPAWPSAPPSAPPAPGSSTFPPKY